MLSDIEKGKAEKFLNDLNNLKTNFIENKITKKEYKKQFLKLILQNKKIIIYARKETKKQNKKSKQN